jgi:UDP-N-acetylmuramate dehydrogenase
MELAIHELAKVLGPGVGGPADILYIARTRDELILAVSEAQTYGVPWRVYGGLTNVLLPDSGLRGLVVLNHLRGYRFEQDRLTAESGVIVVKVAREAVSKGMGGLTWAVGLPGTVGGAVVNNAGAFGGEISKNLLYADVYLPGYGIQKVDESWFEFKYRSSKLKTKNQNAVIINTQFQLKKDEPDRLKQKAEEYTQRRQRTQPAGKTLGSTFKNPEGDYAGRLIDAAGLKGTSIGGFVISEQHANFFLNQGNGLASDYRALMQLVQDVVKEKFSIQLEPEIEILPEETVRLAS